MLGLPPFTIDPLPFPLPDGAPYVRRRLRLARGEEGSAGSLLAAIRDGRHVLVAGARGLGRTSLVEELVHGLRRGGDHLVVRGHALGEDGALETLAKGVPERLAVVVDENVPPEALQGRLAELFALTQAAGAVLVYTGPAEEEGTAWDGLGGAVSAGLGPLDARELDALADVAEPLLGAAIGPDARALLLGTTGGIPLLVQGALADLAIDSREGELPTTAYAATPRGSLTNALRRLAAPLRELSRELVREAQQVLDRLLAGNPPTHDASPLVLRLLRSGLVRSAGGVLVFSAPLVEEWFRSAGTDIARIPWAPAVEAPARPRPPEEGLPLGRLLIEEKHLGARFERGFQDVMRLTGRWQGANGNHRPLDVIGEEAELDGRGQVGPAVPPRFVNLWLAAAELEVVPLAPEKTLLLGEPVQLQLRIGPREDLSIVADPDPFPSQETLERAFPELRGEPIPVDATLYSEDFMFDESTQSFLLPASEPSRLLGFVVRPDRLGPVSLRVCLFYRNHLLQSLVLSAYTTLDEQDAPEPASAAVELTFSASFEETGRFEPRGLFIGVNQTPSLSHRLNVKASGVAFPVPLNGPQVARAAGVLRDALRDVAVVREERPGGTFEPRYRFGEDNRPAGGDEQFRSDLTALAAAGQAFRQAVFDYVPSTAEETKALGEAVGHFQRAAAEPQVIQIARLVDPTHVLPWGMLYDYRLNEREVTRVCRSFLDADGRVRPYEQGRRDCTHFDELGVCERDIVCPYGFWGFKHVLEQPTRPGPGAFGELKDVVATGGRPEFEFAFYSQLAADPALAGHVTQFKQRFVPLDSRAAIEGRLRAEKPHLLYLLCHGEYDTHGSPYLRLGAANETMGQADFGALRLDWDQVYGLVFINGCHTMDIRPEDLSTLSTPFVNAFASGIVGTEVSVGTPLAAEVATRFYTGLLDEGKGVGTILKEVRLALLEKLNPLGLAYTAYCSAGLRIVD